VVLGFFGLGTGYLIYGPQELLGYPRREPNVHTCSGWAGPSSTNCPAWAT
jgi:hypothetical protein